MVRIKVFFLPLFHFLVFCSHQSEVRNVCFPLSYGRWNCCPDDASHQELRGAVTILQWSGTVSQESFVGIVTLFQQILYCSDGSLRLSIPLRVVWASRDMSKFVVLRKLCELSRGVLRPIVGDECLRNAVSCE